ncbi:8523_t:CDS:2 [Rhizophagus irregularis]|nr:8523_t:CDS:2 [Rhizophagus irregularis]
MININFNKGKKRQTNDDELKERESKNPRIEINDEDSTMIIDNNSNSYYNDILANPQYYSQERNSLSYKTSQEENELSNDLNRLEIDKVQVLNVARTVIEGTSSVAKNFATFAPFINSFLDIGKEIIALYEKAEHNKELCGFLLKRCNFAMAEVQDLVIRKTEYSDFFSKQENLSLFKGFIDCMKKIKKFIADVSQFNKLKKFLYANSIEENCTRLEQEFEGYMNSLNFSFALRARNEFATMKYDMKQIKDLLFCVYGVSDDKQTQQNYFDGMDLVVERNKEFQNQNKQRKLLDSSEVEESEPLLDGTQYRKTNVYPSKRIGKRTSLDNCDEFCFKEFSNSSSPSGKFIPYDPKCEIYSVGALLWEIAELKKPHSDISSELIVSIRKRVKENYVLPFSSDVPFEWKSVVSRATEYEPEWRIKISDICIELYRLHKKYSSQNSMPPLSPTPTAVTIPSVEEAVREHKSPNGNKRLAWQSFSYHSETDIEAKYWYGYYYYHEEIPELQPLWMEGPSWIWD